MADVLTVDQAAERLQVKPETIRTWLRLGKLKGIKFGERWRLDPEEIARAAREGLAGAPDPVKERL